MFQSAPEPPTGRNLNFDSDEEGDASPVTLHQVYDDPQTAGREVALLHRPSGLNKDQQQEQKDHTGGTFGSPLYPTSSGNQQSGFSGNSQNTQGTGYSGSIGDGSSTYRTDQDNSQLLEKQQQIGSGDRNPGFGPRSIFASGGGSTGEDFQRGGSSEREGSRISVEDDAVPFASFDSPDRSPGFNTGAETPERKMDRPRGVGVDGHFFQREYQQPGEMFHDMEADDKAANGWYQQGDTAAGGQDVVATNQRGLPHDPRLGLAVGDLSLEQQQEFEGGADGLDEGDAAVASPLGGPQAGRLIFDYSEHKDIGAGDFGTVVAATYDEDGVRYAIKTSKKKVTGEKELQSRLQEVYALSAISSPYLLRYYDAWIENGLVSIKTEYLPDGSVKKLPTPWSEENLWFLLLQTSLGLHALHSANVAHLDIKPDNIFVDLQQHQRIREGGGVEAGEEEHPAGTYPVYKLGDFGLARPVKDHSPVGEHFDGLNEDEGDCRYLCPALLKQTGRISMHLTEADVYSLGASVVDLAGGDPVALRNDGTTTFPITYSDQLKELLLRMLNPEPTLRPSAFQCVEQSTKAVAALLGGGAGGEPLLPEFEMLNSSAVTAVASQYQQELSELDGEYESLLQEYQALQQQQQSAHAITQPQFAAE